MVGQYFKTDLSYFLPHLSHFICQSTLLFNGLIADKVNPANKEAVVAHYLIFAVHILGYELNCSEPSLKVVEIFSATS